MKITKLYPLGEPVPEGSIYLQTIYKREDGTNVPYMMFLVNDTQKEKD